MGESVLLRSFAAGELDPGIGMRGDLELYQRGLRLCRNFLVRRSGGVQSRPGLAHIADCKTDNQTFLYTFIFAAADENYLVEAGEFYFRFHHHLRGMVLELAHPYIEDALRPSNPLIWHQSGLVVSLTHLDYPPMELRYLGPDTFELVPVDVGPTILPPGSLTATPGVTGVRTFRYVVTAVKVDTYEESIASEPIGFAGADLAEPDTPHVLTWDPVANAVEYKVYQDDADNGTYGYLGTATGVTRFNDIGVSPDHAHTPPQQRPLFASIHNYPGVVAVHNQRRIFAGTNNARDQLFASRVGLPYNFTHRSPYQDDDAIIWKTVSKEFQVVLHLVSLAQLVMLTDRGEWVIHGDQDGMLTPSAINPLQKGYVGSGWATPVVYGDRILFVQARQSAIRELGFNVEVQGLSGRDLTVSAAHLFRGHRIVALAFALIPDAVLWCVREDGILLGMTYVPDEDVLAWHQHHTDDGQFEQVVVLPEKDEDAVYCIVHRNGERSIERLGVREVATMQQPRLDRVVRLHATGTRVLLPPHLHGRSVRVVADGVALSASRVTVRGHELVLPAPAAIVDVGLAITCDLETLDLDVSGSPVRDRRKKVTTLAIQVEDSLQNFTAGPDVDHLLPVKAAAWEDPSARKTGRIELTATSYFNDDGRVFVRHTEPTMLTILGILPNADIGG